MVCSNLFKAAVFGRDANWGRILCAIGYTPGDFSIDKVCVWLSSKAGEVYVCENAAYHPYSEDEAAKFWRARYPGQGGYGHRRCSRKGMGLRSDL